MNVILASASPRRRELLQRLGVSFTVVSSNNVEAAIDVTGMTPGEAAVAAARAKAQIVAAANEDAIVLGADTIVVCEGTILNKPMDDKDAKRMLATLSGRRHTVITGIVVCGAGKEVAAQVETSVRFKMLNDQVITDYVLTGEPRDKAGSYGIQGSGGHLVHRIEGSYSNVVGLPLAAVADLLEQFGIRVPGEDDAGHNKNPGGGFHRNPTDTQATTQS